MYISGVQEEL